MSEQTQVSERRPKGRSPSYPAINLESAIQRAQALYTKERQHSTPVATIVKHWGYKSSSGPASLTLAALKKFGLVEDEGVGAARRAKVSDLAVNIIANPDSSARLAAIQEAALRPPIHHELWERYGSAPPSDDKLRWELTRERGFTGTGANEFIPEYRATIGFAQLAGGAVAPQASATHVVAEDKADDTGTRASSRSTPLAPRSHRSTELATTYTIPLISGSSVVVEGPFPVSERDWTQLMAVLAAMKPGLVSDGLHSEDSPDE